MSLIKYQYKLEQGPLGLVARPVANITLESGQGSLTTLMYIDSGADITTIPLGAGVALGFKQAETRIREMRGVSGGGVPYVVETVLLHLEATKLKARIAWALIEEVPFLLGRLDVFKHFDITFQERKNLVLFNPA